MIPVTKTYLPKIDVYQRILNIAWKKKWITNRGELVKKLENKLSSFLEVNNILLTTNGTLPLQIAIKTLGLTKEVITTPFSYVATTSALVWENCTPVYVDIHPEYLTIDETKIEDAITPNTTAILATHVYGNPCNVEAIEKIAKKHSLKVIYDAAHCFGVTYKGNSIFNYGDVSTCSFHATKLFHTGEGGAIFCQDKCLFDELFYHHNFGHMEQDAFHCVGINAKMSELQAAMGLAVLPHVQKIIAGRKKIINTYLDELQNKNLQFIKIRKNANWNYSYFPVLFDSERLLLQVMETLNEHEIFPRRYFYPSLNTLSYVPKQEVPISEDISKRILCLPLYIGLTQKELHIIISLITRKI